MEFKPIAERRTGAEPAGLLQGVEFRGTISDQVDNLFDGNSATRWFDKVGASPEHPSWVELKLKEGAVVPATHYALVSAEDNPEYDPRDWTLLGLLSSDEETGVEYWMAVDEQREVEFARRKCRQEFAVSRPTPCERYKLVITNTKTAGEPLHLACWELYCRPASGQRYGSYAIPLEGGPPSQVQGGLCAGSFPCQSLFAPQPGISWMHPLLVSETRPAWIEYRLWARQSPVTVVRYSMLPDPDICHLDPYSWKLQGWPADDNKWVDLHCVDGEVFTERDEHSVFYIDTDHTIPCIRWRVVITSSTEFEGPVMLRGFALLSHADIEHKVSGEMQASCIQKAEGGRKRKPVRDVVQAFTRPGKGKLPVLRGGFCFASGQNEENGETADKVFDGAWETKWLDPTARAPDGTIRSWVDYQLAPDQEPATLACYSIVSANDYPARDPKEWQLLGLPAVYDASERCVDRFVNDEGWASPTPSSTNQTQWVVLDVQRDVEWAKRSQEKRFPVSQAVPCTLFKLKFTRLRDDAAHLLQLAEINLMVNPKMEPLWAGGDPDFKLEDTFSPTSSTNSTNTAFTPTNSTNSTNTAFTTPSTSQIADDAASGLPPTGLPPTGAAPAGVADDGQLGVTSSEPATHSSESDKASTTGALQGQPSDPFVQFKKVVEDRQAAEGRTGSEGGGAATQSSPFGAGLAGQGSVGATGGKKKRTGLGFLRLLKSKEVPPQPAPPPEELPPMVHVQSAQQIAQEYSSKPPVTSKSEGDAFSEVRDALELRGQALSQLDTEAQEMEDEMAAFAADMDKLLEKQKAKANSWWPL